MSVIIWGARDQPHRGAYPDMDAQSAGGAKSEPLTFFPVEISYTGCPIISNYFLEREIVREKGSK